MSGTLSESAVPNAECGGFLNTTMGPISGKPLGRAIWSSEECVDVVAEPGIFTVRDGRFVLKTRAGAISGEYETRGGLPSARGHVYLWGTFKVSKGTGSYKGATGSGIVGADEDLVTLKIKLEVAGILTSVRANS